MPSDLLTMIFCMNYTSGPARSQAQARIIGRPMCGTTNAGVRRSTRVGAAVMGNGMVLATRRTMRGRGHVGAAPPSEPSAEGLRPPKAEDFRRTGIVFLVLEMPVFGLFLNRRAIVCSHGLRTCLACTDGICFGLVSSACRGGSRAALEPKGR